MKKAGKIILSVIAILLAGTVVTLSVLYTTRGSLKKVTLSEEFETGIAAAQGTQRADGSNVRVMSANLLVHYASWGGEPAKPRAKMFVDVLKAYQPDVIGLQEVCGEWFCCLNRNMPDGYKLLFPATTGVFVNMTAMAYNANTLTLVDSGKVKYTQGDNPRLRRVVWGVFETKDGGRRFAVTSTHLDLIRENQEDAEFETMSSQADELFEIVAGLREKYDCPVFSTGDFNAMENGGIKGVYDAPEIYEKLAANLTDTKNIAADKQHGGAHGLEVPTYDHIFLKGEAQIPAWRILSETWLTPMSDHYPMFIDAAV